MLPITSLGLQHEAPLDRVSAGLDALDAMLGGQGFYRGSSILLSGGAGTGKSSLAAHFVDATCRRGERCVYFLFEESPSQYMRNMRSIGIDLEAWMKDGRLHFHAARPALLGLEQHLVAMHRAIEQVRPSVVVVDPINDLMSVGTTNAVKATLLRLIDYLKTSHITAFFSSLTSGDAHEQTTVTGISSLMDTWILLRAVEAKDRRHRGLYVLKSRGMAHSNKISSFFITDQGVRLGGRAARAVIGLRDLQAAAPIAPKRAAPSACSGSARAVRGRTTGASVPAARSAAAASATVNACPRAHRYAACWREAGWAPGRSATGASWAIRGGPR